MRAELALAEPHRRILAAGLEFGGPFGVVEVGIQRRHAEAVGGGDRELGRLGADEGRVVDAHQERGDELLWRDQEAALGVGTGLKRAHFLGRQHRHRRPGQELAEGAHVHVDGLVVRAGLLGAGLLGALGGLGRRRGGVALGLVGALLALDRDFDFFLRGEQVVVLLVFLGQKVALFRFRLVDEIAHLLDDLAPLLAEGLQRVLRHDLLLWSRPP